MPLPDVNVWLAMAFEVHAHHRTAAAWFDSVEPGACGFCRMAQQGFLRLATNPAVFGGEAVTLDEAWSLYDRLKADDRVSFLAEPAGLESVWRRHATRRSYSPKVWNDAYLAAFAERSALELVTFDAGFRDYSGLAVRVLAP